MATLNRKLVSQLPRRSPTLLSPAAVRSSPLSSRLLGSYPITTPPFTSSPSFSFTRREASLSPDLFEDLTYTKEMDDDLRQIDLEVAEIERSRDADQSDSEIHVPESPPPTPASRLSSDQSSTPSSGNISVLGPSRSLVVKKRTMTSPFQSIPVLRAFSIYFTAYGIQTHPSSEDTERPIGALALTAAAVERGYYLHRTGDYASCSNEFSATNWVKTTNLYIDKINNDLTDDNWKAIFDALDRLQETRAHEARVEAGVVPEEREPLLPADPPSPPPV